MIALGGFLSLVVAAVGAAWLTVAGLRRVTTGEGASDALRLPVRLLLGGGIAAMGFLELGIVLHDYSIEYIASNTATETPFIFLLASGWAALEGSVLLWGLLVTVFAWLVYRTVSNGDGLGAGALGIIGAVALFWFGAMITVANPFRVCTAAAEVGCQASSWFPLASSVAPLNGLGPNALLQNHILMAIHPPMLYLGFVGMTAPFAFAISALLRGESGNGWLERTRRWSVLAWVFLTIGLILGGWWSYEVLGWGGYWAWDPVENGTLIPWLAATAFIHSSVIQRRRGMLQAWNIVLVIATFSLTILATFLTRSGVVFSVHAFSQSGIGPAILIFLAFIVLGSFALFAFRAHLVAQAPRVESLVSREGVFLLNNLLLAVWGLAILLGTLAPTVMEAINGNRVTVGRPFYDRITLPIVLVLLLAIGVGPIMPYRVASMKVVWTRLRSPMTAALIVGAGLVFIGVRSVPTIIAIILSSFIAAAITRLLWTRISQVAKTGIGMWGSFVRVVKNEPGFWGGQLSHLGVAIMAIGIAATTGLASQSTIELRVGESVPVEGYCITYDGPFERQDPHRVVRGIEVGILDASCSTRLKTLAPSTNVYKNSATPIGTPSVYTTIVEDVYVRISAGSAENPVIDVFVFPVMWMVWLGGGVTSLGGVLSVVSRRSKRKVPIDA